MARPRLRLRRLLVIVVMLAILVLLLELDRLLPGGWPGGGGSGGFRADARAPGTASGLLEPVDEPPAWPDEGVIVTVMGADGRPVRDWRLEVGGAGPRLPEDDGRLRVAPAALEGGFAVESPAGRLRHPERAIVPAPAAVVHVPPATVPAEGPRPRPPRLRRIETRLVGEGSGETLAPTHVRLLGSGGDVLLAPDPEALGDRLRLDVPEHLARGAVLEVGATGRPVVRVPLDAVGAVLRLPAGRRFGALASGEAAGAGPARLAARFVPPTLGGDEGVLAEPIAVQTPLDDVLVLPEGVAATIVVIGPDGRAGTARVAPDDPAGILDVPLAAGRTVTGRVIDERSQPIVGARVVLRAVVDGLLLSEETTTDAGGAFRIAAPGAATAEVFAHAPGRVWAAALLPADESATLRLAPAAPLRLSVQGPDGVPLAGVRVRTVPSQGAPDVTPPGAGPVLTDARGHATVPSLALRDHDVHLALPGWQEQILGRVRPGVAVHYVTLLPAE